MKCPKCQYISFDSGERCRNCGYDFSLALDLPAPDLPIQDGSEPIGPLADFTLREKAPDTGPLPLFRRGDPDAPLVTPSATPRAPLAVRRGAPTAPRPRHRRAEPDPEPRLALDTSDFAIVPDPPPAAAAPAPSAAPVSAHAHVTASAGARLAGGAIDGSIIFAIDLAVVYFTLKICDLGFPQAAALPLAPLLAFLALLNGGYLATFIAAGGQTIGKMAAGTRVVPADPAAPPSERVSFGQAALRAAAYLASLLPFGLGFIPALFGEGRAFHDRLADTRVVRA
jgi:uncharacterized RDD family membrane protein YckC